MIAVLIPKIALLLARIVGYVRLLCHTEHIPESRDYTEEQEYRVNHGEVCQFIFGVSQLSIAHPMKRPMKVAATRFIPIAAS